MKKILDLLGGNVIDGINSIIGKFKMSPDEKMAMKIQMEELVDRERMRAHEAASTELRAKQAIITAELTQGDNFTKRARPTVVYFGLFVIFYNYCLIPSIQAIQGMTLEPFMLPTEFWVAWGGIVATWTIGRSYEKRGGSNAVSRAVTGSKPVSFMD